MGAIVLMSVLIRFFIINTHMRLGEIVQCVYIMYINSHSSSLSTVCSYLVPLNGVIEVFYFFIGYHVAIVKSLFNFHL